MKRGARFWRRVARRLRLAAERDVACRKLKPRQERPYDPIAEARRRETDLFARRRP